MKRMFLVVAAAACLFVARPAEAQTAAEFQAARDLVVAGSVASFYQCPGLDRTLYAILQHAEAVGPGARRCAALSAALHCVTRAGRTGLPLSSSVSPAVIDVTFARFRQDGASLAFAAALAAALQGLLQSGGC